MLFLLDFGQLSRLSARDGFEFGILGAWFACCALKLLPAFLSKPLGRLKPWISLGSDSEIEKYTLWVFFYKRFSGSPWQFHKRPSHSSKHGEIFQEKCR